MKLKFYALCSRNIFALSRHTDFIQRDELRIVINTLDDDFRKRAVDWCISNDVEYFVTDSDGTAATGKNSVLDIIASSDDDYAVMIDGDDFLTGHGVYTYKALVESGKAPDVLALQCQMGIVPNYDEVLQRVELSSLISPRGLIEGDVDPDAVPADVKRCYAFPAEYWMRSVQADWEYDGDLTPLMKTQIEQQKRWATYVVHNINNIEAHLRIVMISKKIAETYRFDNSLKVGEDTLFYVEMKHRFLNGEITMKHLFDKYPTYVYDTRVSGVVHQESLGGKESWKGPLCDKYEEYTNDGRMRSGLVPRVIVCDSIGFDVDSLEEHNGDCDIVWPEGYKPNCFDLVPFPLAVDGEYNPSIEGLHHFTNSLYSKLSNQ